MGILDKGLTYTGGWTGIMQDVEKQVGRQPNSHGCFICGLRNPIGLKMVFHEDYEQKRVLARLSVPECYRSYPGVVHGGIVATILDETSGRALMIYSGDINDFFVTAKMEVRYRRATPTETPLVAVGWVERYGERARVRGELRLAEGGPEEPVMVLAECTSLVVRPQQEFLEGWGEEAPHWRVYSDSELLESGARV
jgi:acyl-coenzyme A thioesterase PaaI-like protein